MRQWPWFVGGVVAIAGVLLALSRLGGRDDRPRVAEGPLEISEETTRITEPLTADGRPDYVAALNAEPAPPPEENAAIPLLRVVGTRALVGNVPEILRQLGAPNDLPIEPAFVPAPDELQEDLWDLETELEDEDDGEAEDAEPWEVSAALRAWLAANRAPLDGLVEATRRARLWWPVARPPGAGLIDTALPTFALADLVEALSARAAVAAIDGDLRRGWSDAAALLRLYRLGSGLRGSLARVTAGAIQQKALLWVRYMLQQQSPDAALTGEVIRTLASVSAPRGLLTDLDIFDRYGVLDGFLVQVGPIGRTAALSPALRALNQGIDLVVELLRQPDGETLDALEQHVAEVEERLETLTEEFGDPLGMAKRVGETILTGGAIVSRLVGELMAQMVTVVTPMVFRQVHEGETKRHVALVALALHAHGLRTGAFPESLDALVPTELASLPRASLDGTPVAYVRTEAGCVVGPGDAEDGSGWSITLGR